ncbi:MAG: hypothetical protein MK137_04495 [Rickettsiales bacterium]|nr:hypothetical protein [Rickettsiales bacterium]
MAQNNYGRVASSALTRGFVGSLAGFGVALAVLIGVAAVTPVSAGVFAGSVLGGMALGGITFGVAGGYKAQDSSRVIDAKVRSADARGAIANSKSVDVAKGKSGRSTNHADKVLQAREAQEQVLENQRS